ncbi:hypothetical protein SeLEV6574_g03907 [Synchytrium endobioticum]|uniref:Uncharacterized protein n=1 Tax=Synchytrium endobioticum TaxID=286115 RepID=A0A507D271_9FUNG|nr:hypothetical protein SeLEV6574_g03907 [Synchytrium endobioticum]
MKEKGDFSKEEMLKKYLLLCKSDRNFDVAKGVFFNFDEGKVLDPLDCLPCLPNIFHNNTLRSTHKDAWVIAIDPGATRIARAVAFDPKHPDRRRNLAVTTRSLAEPERRYTNWLEVDKPEAICTAERECTKSDQETWAVFLERFVQSYDIARAYYSTKKYKRKRWDADKAKRGELDRVLEGIVNMVDESMGHKLSGGKKVIVAIGMGDFSSTKSRHVMFIR